MIVELLVNVENINTGSIEAHRGAIEFDTVASIIEEADGSISLFSANGDPLHNVISTYAKCLELLRKRGEKWQTN